MSRELTGAFIRWKRGARLAKDVAQQASISAQFLCDIELGRRIPSPDTARALSLALGLEAEEIGRRVAGHYYELYCGVGPAPAAAPTERERAALENFEAWAAGGAPWRTGAHWSTDLRLMITLARRGVGGARAAGENTDG